MSHSASSSGAPAELPDRLTQVLGRLGRSIRRNDPSGRGYAFAIALVTVENRGPITIGDLASLEGVSAPTMTRIVDRMEAAGFVDRVADPIDRSMRRISITRAGSEHLAQARRERSDWLRDRLAMLTETQRTDIELALGALEAMLPEESRD